jgi:hypothetical protein
MTRFAEREGEEIQKFDFSKRNKPTDTDRILQYLKSSSPDALMELDDREKAKLDKMLFAERMLGKFHTKRQVATMITNTYKNERTGLPLSVDQGYRIIRETEKVFGVINKINPNFLAGMAYDLIMDTIRICKEKADARGLNAATKNLIELMKLFSTGANKLPADMLDRISVTFQVKPELLGIEPMHMSEMESLLQELKEPTRTIDITDEQKPRPTS